MAPRKKEQRRTWRHPELETDVRVAGSSWRCSMALGAHFLGVWLQHQCRVRLVITEE